MSKCDKCSTILAPNFLRPIAVEGEDDDHICLFCDIDQDFVKLKNGQKYTKKQAAKDYKKLLNYLKEKVDQMGDIKKGAKTVSDSGLILPGTAEFEEALKGK